tara:strand:+ start:96153 stop:96800 length:648 start_codon:yes stop_codon:yes gene_type:complete
MAEIKVEKKKSIWAWVTVLIIVIGIGIAYLYYSNLGERPVPEALQDEKVDVGLDDGTTLEGNIEKDSLQVKADQEVAEYISYVMDKNRMGSDLQYTQNALVQLYNTIQAVASVHHMENMEALGSVSADVKKVTGTTHAPDSLSSAIKRMGGSMVKVMGEIQQQHFPDHTSKITELEGILQELDPNRKVADQKEKVVDFFDRAGKLLKEMNPKSSV